MLNLDCDFFYDTDVDTSLSSKKTRVVSTSDFLSSIQIDVGTTPVLCLDHHEALAAWDRDRVREALCVHFDAHHDLHTDFNRSWETPFGVRGRHVGAGDYLFHALRERIVETVLWVTPNWIEAGRVSSELRRLLGAALSQRVSVVRFRDFRWHSPPASHVVVALSPEWTPRVDLDAAADLASRIGSTPDAVERWKDAARQRYAALAGDASPLALRFRFPSSVVEAGL